MHYYKRNIGDYFKKAGRLSILQHGVYNLLLDACYDRERFPTREEAIDWVWAGTPEEIQAVDFVLGKFFVLQDGLYVQSRIAEEIAEYRLFCDKQAENGKSGGRPKKPNGFSGEPSGKPVESQAHENKTLITNQEPLTTNHEEGAEPSASAPVLPTGLNTEAWERWLKFRRKVKFKPYATDETALMLSQHPPDVQAAAINHSMQNQYQGLFPDKFTGAKNAAAKAKYSVWSELSSNSEPACGQVVILPNDRDILAEIHEPHHDA